ncbi:hypothetical protein BRADI_1g10175v3 [Brachypodium distachyon]|uniref:Uncharacterized protein n=1 Tax=Brachypodium distachyon TaxID=15368 RepID=A0A2K2DIV8_BRADI|nr:hypothetical protein BRADI_1g10175v3 [Brachypodium distachyon]
MEGREYVLAMHHQPLLYSTCRIPCISACSFPNDSPFCCPDYSIGWLRGYTLIMNQQETKGTTAEGDKRVEALASEAKITRQSISLDSVSTPRYRELHQICDCIWHMKTKIERIHTEIAPI